MAEPAVKPMSVEQFYAWGELQEERYEFVDGFPVRMMSGASRRHDQIVVNVLLALRGRLRGRPERPFSAGTAVATTDGRRRRPDAGIEVGELRDNDYVANEPRIVVEVLSRFTREFDLLAKLDEYKALPSLREIVVVEPNAPDAMLWSRAEDGPWSGRRIQSLEEGIPLASLGIELPMSEIYDGLTFRPWPKIVAVPE